MGSLEQAVYAILIAFVIGVILCPILIPVLHKMKFGQNVRDDGPQTHLQLSLIHISFGRQLQNAEKTASMRHMSVW